MRTVSTRKSLTEVISELPGDTGEQNKYFVGFYNDDKLIAVMDLITEKYLKTQQKPAEPRGSAGFLLLHFVFHLLIVCVAVVGDLGAESKAGDEAVNGGFIVDRRPCIDVLFFSSPENLFVRKTSISFSVFISRCPLFLLGASDLRINIAILKLFNKNPNYRAGYSNFQNPVPVSGSYCLLMLPSATGFNVISAV